MGKRKDKNNRTKKQKRAGLSFTDKVKGYWDNTKDKRDAAKDAATGYWDNTKDNANITKYAAKKAILEEVSKKCRDTEGCDSAAKNCEKRKARIKELKEEKSNIAYKIDKYDGGTLTENLEDTDENAAEDAEWEKLAARREIMLASVDRGKAGYRNKKTKKKKKSKKTKKKSKKTKKKSKKKRSKKKRSKKKRS